MKHRRSGTPVRRTPRRPNPRLRVEALDDRCLPSTFTVTNLFDSGAGSLRAAVAAANANPGADAIDFATTGNIALTSGQLDITASLTINGPGESALTVSGEGISRVFGIAGNPTVVIAGLTVANGSTTGSPGGGLSMAGGTVTLDHVTVTGNFADGNPGGFSYVYYPAGDGLGGGLYVAGGTLTLDQCTVSGNYAGGGAGYSDFYAGGNGGNGAGGGLYLAGGTVRVNQSTIANNGVYGGAGGDGLIYSGEPTSGGAGGYA